MSNLTVAIIASPGYAKDLGKMGKGGGDYSTGAHRGKNDNDRYLPYGFPTRQE